MSDASAMFLAVFMSIALVVFAIAIIALGGRRARDRVKRNRQHIGTDRPKAA